MAKDTDLLEPVPPAKSPITGTHPDPDAATDELRLLAQFTSEFRHRLDKVSRSIGSSQVRAAVFVALCEDIHRISGYGQILAAARAADAKLHTIAEAPLAELNELLAEPAAFMAGECDLPADATSAPGRKPLFRDEAEFLETQQNLSHFQALHRVETAANLLPHTGFNGREIAPRYPRLGAALSEGAADPRTLAGLAKKITAMGPEIERQPDPAAALHDLEAELADAARTRNIQGTDRLLKDHLRRLESSAKSTPKNAETPYLGAYYIGHSHKGYEYRIITNAEGHELLATAADALNNPRTKTGTTPANPLPIPEWAIDPNTAPGQIPVQDLGAADGGPEFEPGMVLRAGEALDQARARQRAERLHRFVLDSIRVLATTGTPPSGGAGRTQDEKMADDPPMPLAPQFTLAVTIDFLTLSGQLNKSGITDHGLEVTAQDCRRIACNAGILPVVLAGDGVPLELGRTRRYFNLAQRRAIAVRDKGCCNPGCSMPVNRTEAHHLDPWSAGGRTDVSRGCLLCVRCHVAHHAGHFAITMIKGLPHVIPPRSTDPQQIPRRNWIFHPTAGGLAAKATFG
ncbi:MAG: DUF222 domain-containing protein [Micrococcaceae bacterium]|nr:DUF222 domain-containing protein [Micrococcaceae bacterium]